MKFGSLIKYLQEEAPVPIKVQPFYRFRIELYLDEPDDSWAVLSGAPQNGEAFGFQEFMWVLRKQKGWIFPSETSAVELKPKQAPHRFLGGDDNPDDPEDPENPEMYDPLGDDEPEINIAVYATTVREALDIGFNLIQKIDTALNLLDKLLTI